MPSGDIKILIIIALLFIMFICVFRYPTNEINEHMDNNEAIANIASIYSEQLAKFDNLTISKDILTGTVSTPILKAPASINVSSPLVIGNQLCAGGTCIDAQNLIPLLRARQFPYIYSIKPGDSIVYNDIFAALNNNIIAQSGSPAGWNNTSYASNPWNGYKILCIGVGNTNDSAPAGITVNVPQGMKVIWLRVLNCDRWTTITVKGYPVNTCGYRCTAKMRPDGAEDTGTCHRWVPYPVSGPGQYYVSGGNASFTQSGNWISGIGFSTNPYNHAMSSGVAYLWKVNGGSGVAWYSSSWPSPDGSGGDGGDNLAYVPKGQTANLVVPVVNSGIDKMLYILSLGRQTDSGYVSQCKVTVNGTTIDSFYPHDNVFLRYYNSKPNLTYLCARVPASLVTGTTISVVIDATATTIGDNIYFREVGTHDY